jgi:hypothetical protein
MIRRSTKPVTSRTHARPLAPLAPAALAVFAALSLTGCSKLAISWTPKPGAIEVAASGFTDAYLVVLAGPPTGPLLRRETPGIWTTVGFEPGSPILEIARTSFDAAGTAKLSIEVSRLSPGKPLLQALVLTRDDGQLAVSACQAVRVEDGVPRLTPHVLEVIRSPAALRLLGVALVVLACVLLRRLRVEAPGPRILRVALVLACAAFLLLQRAVTPSGERNWDPEPTPPLWPGPLAERLRTLDPVDRVTIPGLRDLVENARRRTPGDVRIGILPASDSGESMRDAWQAAWLVWPRRAEVLKPDADPFARRGFYVVLGERSKREAGVLFRNQAGGLFAVAEGEPR